jgi:hypothetical protein
VLPPKEVVSRRNIRIRLCPKVFDTAQGIGRQVLERGIPVDGHDQVRLGQQRVEYVHDAVDPAKRGSF